MLYLKQANFEDIEKEHAFVANEPADENGFMNDAAGISFEEFKTATLPRMIDWAQGKNLPEDLRLLIEEARKIVPEDELYMHCNSDNPASLKVMLKNGGVIHHKNESGFYVRIKLR